MNIIKFDHTKYELLCEWWKDHNWPNISLESLPTTGYIIEKNETKVCAGFLYKSDSNITWLEFIISNKKCNYETKQEGLDLLIKTLCDEAKKDGYSIVFTSCSHNGLIEKYSNNGFKKTDINMTNMMRVL
jgi:hypothetical protein